MGQFFKIFQNLSQSWLKFENYRTIWWFWSGFGSKWGRSVYEWVTCSWKIGKYMGLLSNFAAALPYQNQTWVPPLRRKARIWSATLMTFFSWNLAPEEKNNFTALCSQLYLKIYTKTCNLPYLLTEIAGPSQVKPCSLPYLFQSRSSFR